MYTLVLERRYTFLKELFYFSGLMNIENLIQSFSLRKLGFFGASFSGVSCSCTFCFLIYYILSKCQVFTDKYKLLQKTSSSLDQAFLWKLILLIITLNIHGKWHWTSPWLFYNITKTYLYSFDPLKLHFYVVKLGFTGVYIIFLISAQNIDYGYLLEPPRRGGSNEYP